MVLLVHLLACCTERQTGTRILCNQTTKTFSSEDNFGNTAEVTGSYISTKDVMLVGLKNPLSG